MLPWPRCQWDSSNLWLKQITWWRVNARNKYLMKDPPSSLISSKYSHTYHHRIYRKTQTQRTPTCSISAGSSLWLSYSKVSKYTKSGGCLRYLVQIIRPTTGVGTQKWLQDRKHLQLAFSVFLEWDQRKYGPTGMLKRTWI